LQVLQAGRHKLILLELELELLTNLAKQAGFDSKIEDSARSLLLDLTATGRQSPLLLFDAADPANLGWFSDASSTWKAEPARSCRHPSRLPTNAIARVIRKPTPFGFASPKNSRRVFSYPANSRSPSR
jgi:hypothetical protein